ncbi:MAG: hypothetical protein R3F14_17715 [Polyangiaceae bacterium]
MTEGGAVWRRLGRVRAEVGWLVAIVGVGLALRIAFNDVERFSPADEAHYVEAARRLGEGGWGTYPALVRDALADGDAWKFPTPLRWGYLALATGACAVRGACDGRALAWLSTVAGAVSVLPDVPCWRAAAGGGAGECGARRGCGA